MGFFRIERNVNKLCRVSEQELAPSGPQSQAAASLATYLSALSPALHLTRAGHNNTQHQSLYLVLYLSSQDESVQDPERARMENLNYLLSKVFDGWRMATNKVLITDAGNNGKEVPRWGVAEIQKMSPSTTGRCYCCH